MITEHQIPVTDEGAGHSNAVQIKVLVWFFEQWDDEYAEHVADHGGYYKPHERTQLIPILEEDIRQALRECFHSGNRRKPFSEEDIDKLIRFGMLERSEPDCPDSCEEVQTYQLITGFLFEETVYVPMSFVS